MLASENISDKETTQAQKASLKFSRIPVLHHDEINASLKVSLQCRFTLSRHEKFVIHSHCLQNNVYVNRP